MDGVLATLAMKLSSSPLVRATRLGSAFLALFLVPASLAQTTWYVDPSVPGPGNGTELDPYASIQFAVDQPTTVDGDVLQLSAGLYFEVVLVTGKQLELRGDPEGLTSIQANGAGVPLTVSGPPTLGTIVRDLNLLAASQASSAAGPCLWVEDSWVDLVDVVVLNGSADLGGGVRASNSMLSMLRCTVTQCYASTRGGGLHAEDCDLVIKDSTFVNNNGWGGGLPGYPQTTGGHISVQGGTLVMQDSDVRTEGTSGTPALISGGIDATCDSIVVEGCWFESLGCMDHHAVGRLEADVVEVLQCAFLDNWTYEYTGGLAIYGGSAWVEDCVFADNHCSVGRTGALTLGASQVTLEGCLFSGNHSVEAGAVTQFSGHVNVSNCRFERNQAYPPYYWESGTGGAWRAHPGSTTSFDHCVFWRNESWGRLSASPSFPSQPGLGAAVEAPAATLSHCSLFGNVCHTYPEDVTGPTVLAEAVENCIVWGESPYPFELGLEPSTVEWSIVQGDWPGEGNQDADPLFWLPDEGDLHLRPGSPAIDAGDPLAPFDADGTVADVGAFPFETGYTPAPATYCEPKESAQGCVPVLSWNGVPSLSDPTGVQVLADQVDVNRWGLVLWAFAPNDQPFFGGTLCLGTGLERGPAHLSVPVGPDPCDGRLEALFVGTDLALQGVSAGDSLYVQFWYRDNLAPEPVGLTGGLRLTWAP